MAKYHQFGEVIHLDGSYNMHPKMMEHDIAEVLAYLEGLGYDKSGKVKAIVIDGRKRHIKMQKASNYRPHVIYNGRAIFAKKVEIPDPKSVNIYFDSLRYRRDDTHPFPTKALEQHLSRQVLDYYTDATYIMVDNQLCNIIRCPRKKYGRIRFFKSYYSGEDAELTPDELSTIIGHINNASSVERMESEKDDKPIEVQKPKKMEKSLQDIISSISLEKPTDFHIKPISWTNTQKGVVKKVLKAAILDFTKWHESPAAGYRYNRDTAGVFLNKLKTAMKHYGDPFGIDRNQLLVDIINFQQHEKKWYLSFQIPTRGYTALEISNFIEVANEVLPDLDVYKNAQISPLYEIISSIS